MADALLMPGSPAGMAWWSGWAAFAAAASAVLTFVTIQWADRLGVVDRPNARSSHVRPTPRGGGIAIVAVGLVAVAALLAAGMVPPTNAGWVMAAAVLVAAVSGIDDVSSISPPLRLALHLGTALVTVWTVGPVETIDLGPLGSLDLGLVAWPLTVIWIVGMTNAFNFMDGIDGIAGITAVVALGVLAAGLWLAGEAFGSLVAAALAAAAAGFLVWNWQPAKIFMGDVGSAFLGYVIAVLPLVAGPEARRWLVPLAALVMWPFIVDTAFTLVRRFVNGENILQAHRSHIYQRMVIAGWSHRAVATLYGLASLVAGLVALSVLARQASPS